MPDSTVQYEQCLRALLTALIDQGQARVLVPPNQNALGFWFGGGNLVRDEQGTIWLCGRYRNYGDSRTGLRAGQRGVECALFRSDDGGHSFASVQLVQGQSVAR